ncbi:MAG: methionyl-tRNA formyltransferase [Clostridiales bacterium]|nr:methionyl-tRNA formyltransferase [Clostridiales bacterium]
MDIVFLGTPDFAVPSLKALVENGYNVKAVFTQPDRPKGRGNKVQFSPVKEYAIENNIPIYQPDKIRLPQNAQILKDLKPDLMITCAFGQILSKENLDTAPLGCINVHGSLLPKYRGSSPIQWAIINGEKVTGITTMYTDIGVDCGDIIHQNILEIGENETAGELFDRLSLLGAQTLLETLKLLENGNIKRTKQDEQNATHFPMLDKKMAGIDFNKTSQEIKNLVRGLNPWPVAWAKCGEDIIKIYSVSVLNEKTNKIPGTVLCADSKNGLKVATNDGVISIDLLQFSGKKTMEAKTYFVGNKLKADFLVNE